MNKTYHFTVKSLIPARLYGVVLVFLVILLSYSKSKQAAPALFQAYGGPWLFLALTVSVFAEAFVALLGNRLAIADGSLELKTAFGSRWVIPIASISRFDPKATHQRRKTCFSFTTDGKEYVVPYELQNYQEFLGDIKLLNPNIQIAKKQAHYALDEDMGKLAHRYVDPGSTLGKIAWKATRLNFVGLFLVFFVLMIVFIIALAALAAS